MCTTDHEQLQSAPRDELVAVDRLRHAIEANELVLHYQPQLSLSSGRIVGAEALVRWRSAERGLIPPAEFIGLAERNGLIELIDECVLRTACLQARSWQSAGLHLPRTTINLSGHLLQMPDAVRRIERVLIETGVDPHLLGLEITESMFMRDLEHVSRALTQLKAFGLEISLDDFGTGYSSLSYLRRLPIDVVKVDRSFINDVMAAPESVSMTRAIISMAHGLNLQVLAEGVETEGQLALLLEHQCDQIQGYYFSPAVAADDLASMLRDGRCLPPNLIRDRQIPRTLLLVDDEESIVASLRRLLRRDGYQIVTANSGAEGLQRMAEHTIDVVISDQRMPGMTGVEFLRRAKELYPDTIRIVLSGYTELQSITDAINEGAIYKFLTKPWDDEQLREQISEAFQRKLMADENRRLGQKVEVANRELADVNRRLRSVLDSQREQINRSENRLTLAGALLDRLPVPVIGLDTEGLIVFANEAAETALMRDDGSRPALIGEPACEALPPPMLGEDGQTVLLGHNAFVLVTREITDQGSTRGRLLTLLPAPGADTSSHGRPG
ncbi:EAL domain-containing protein [Aquabacterium sp.]|uniref:EAL domain-containing protein n=1 Tax=Aquabacterium sp. TaxID=1872578 RepID=UPI0035B42602